MSSLSIPPEALVVVADGRKALLLRNQGDAEHLNLKVEQVLEQENPASHEHGSDRPGRSSSPSGGARAALEEVDWHQQEEDRFAVRVAEVLYQKAHANEFQALVLVAAPIFLGVLRQNLHQEATHRVLAEFPKTLTSHPVAEIERALAS